MSTDEIKYINKYKRRQILIKIIQVSIVFLFITLWQYLSTKKIINPFIFSSPIKIIKTIINLYTSKILYNNVITTIKEIIYSFTIGLAISTILSLTLYLSNTFYKIIDPFINLLNSLPKICLGPILIIWFGANTNTIIVMSLLINIIVCTQTLYTGFINCNKYNLLLFKSFKANKLNTIIHLIIPSSYKNIITALKLNISMTLIGVIMGEFLVSKCGIGYLIIYGTQVFNLDLVYTGVVLLIILSYIIYKPINILENKIKK